MKKFFAASAVALSLTAMSALPALAATTHTDSNNITSGDGDGTFKSNFKGSGTGSFTATFDFVVSAMSNVMAKGSVTNSFTTFLDLTSFVITGNGMTETGSFTTTSGSQQGTIAQFLATPGNYTLTVDGSVLKQVGTTPPTASFNGNVSLTPVPLPTSVALFGVALAGLGMAGAIRRKAGAKAAV